MLFEFGQAEQILNDVFKHRQFRGLQSTVIRAIAAGQHALVIMPTGMGKSLCYQIPAMAIAQGKNLAVKNALTLVLSPLVALMKDQVDALQQKGIDATFVNSSLTRQERNGRHDSIASGCHDILYVTPERFRKPDFLEVLQKRSVKLLAVDEAHCISEWGHDFRPDYTRVGLIRELLDFPVTIALTATATPDVQLDIVRQLGLSPSEVELFHQGIERPNLALDVVQVWDDDAKLERMIAIRRDQSGSGIVYFTLIKTLLQFSDRLFQQGVDHLIYHGELERERRKRLQDQFMNNPGHLVLATNAFGMGIDKEDIRFVLHAELPGTLESYYQEIGRAGRDGLPASCLLMYDERDLATQMEFLRWSNPDAVFYRRVFDLISHELEHVNAFGLDWLRERLHHKQKHDRRLETALSMLKRWEVISGSLDPLNVELVGQLPVSLKDPLQTEIKLQRDQQKLYSLLQYVKHTGDRKQFINDYFGV